MGRENLRVLVPLCHSPAGHRNTIQQRLLAAPLSSPTYLLYAYTPMPSSLHPSFSPPGERQPAAQRGGVHAARAAQGGPIGAAG